VPPSSDVKQAYAAWAATKFPGEGIEATTIVPEICDGARLVA
jgi:hypothetical protein